MARVLESAVPRFLQQLSADYAAWAAGDDSRQPVSEGGLLDEAALRGGDDGSGLLGSEAAAALSGGGSGASKE
jgi:hypothetical protein